jgi:hypothetical protein
MVFQCRTRSILSVTHCSCIFEACLAVFLAQPLPVNGIVTNIVDQSLGGDLGRRYDNCALLAITDLAASQLLALVVMLGIGGFVPMLLVCRCPRPGQGFVAFYKRRWT